MGISRQAHGIVMFWLGVAVASLFWMGALYWRGGIALGFLFLLVAGAVSLVDGRGL